MGLFKKKGGSVCAVCGGETTARTFFGAVRIVDGILCENCALKLRGDYPVSEHAMLAYGSGVSRNKSDDPLSGFTTNYVKELIEELDEKQGRLQEQYAGKCNGVLSVDYVGVASPRVINSGFLRRGQLDGKLIIRGLVAVGSFSKHDAVLIRHGEECTRADILDVVRCVTGSDLMNMVNEKIHVMQVTEGENAWVILDLESGVKKKDLIIKE